MALQRGFFAATAAAMLLLVGQAAATASVPEQDAPIDASTVYYVRHAISNDADAGDDVVHAGYYRAALQPAPSGAQQLAWVPLWAQQVDAAGKASYLLDLDPGNADDAQRIAVLAAGFTTRMAPSAEPAALRAVDAKAWSTLARRSPQHAQDLLVAQQAPGLRPIALPASVAVGDTLRSGQGIAPYASATATLRVLEVTPEAVLMRMDIDETGTQGEGRLVVRRTDGMPIELRMEMRYAASGKRPATTHRVHLADVRHDLMLHMADDLQSYVSYVEQIEQTLRAPPFSSPAADASAYTHRAAPRGALESYMVGADALPALQPFMGSLWVPAETGNRQRLAIGARAAGPARPGTARVQDEPVLMSRLHEVALLDGNGAPIAALAPTLVTRTLFFPEKYSVAQNDLNFPFHLPLGAPRAALDQITAVQMVVDAEVYQVEGAEKLRVGQRSTLNPQASVSSSSPYRATLLQGRQAWKDKTGLYSVLVLLDADGNVLPTEQLQVAPYKAVQATRLADVPLAWENGSIPMRTEIATQRPIGQVELRHYRWTSVPRTWVFPMYP